MFFNASNKVVLLNSLPYHSKVNPSNKIFNGEVLKENTINVIIGRYRNKNTNWFYCRES